MLCLVSPGLQPHTAVYGPSAAAAALGPTSFYTDDPHSLHHQQPAGPPPHVPRAQSTPAFPNPVGLAYPQQPPRTHGQPQDLQNSIQQPPLAPPARVGPGPAFHGFPAYPLQQPSPADARIQEYSSIMQQPLHLLPSHNTGPHPGTPPCWVQFSLLCPLGLCAAGLLEHPACAGLGWPWAPSCGLLSALQHVPIWVLAKWALACPPTSTPLPIKAGKRYPGSRHLQHGKQHARCHVAQAQGASWGAARYR